MQTTFVRRKKEFSPIYFSVIFYKGGKTQKIPGKIESDADLSSRFPDAIKCEVYKNGTHNLSAEMIDQIFNT